MKTYNLKPEIKVRDSSDGWEGYEAIAQVLKEKATDIKLKQTVLAIECYPGVNLEELRAELLPKLEADAVVYADDYALTEGQVQDKIKDSITDDRVFGILSHYDIKDFYEESAIQKAKLLIADMTGLVVIYGMGTTLLADADLLVYADLTRWEIQCRYRNEGLANWKTLNSAEDALRKYKQGYFFEWRMADRQKNNCYGEVDYLLDTNKKNQPSMIDGQSYRDALKQVASAPFRLVPYFDASVWGGQWMKENFGLDPEADNFGWAFDGVPEENSILLDFNGTRIEVPSINVVFQHPNELLGPKVHARFGKEFPIRFDYLDTMGGGNLSLQVHPLIEYAQDKFGIHYTQDESYYILDSSPRSTVYLGVKEHVDREEMRKDLEKAAQGGYRFPDEKYVNVFPVKKHDHVLIPAGTIHCSGPDTVILEISATPYIFTFKLWDWSRIGLDGMPRPVHIEHGVSNILMDRDREYADKNLIRRVDDEYEDLSIQEDVKTERTGLHELEFIETHRHWFKNSAHIHCHESVNMLNLVEGETAEVVSVDDSFEPFPVSYGETFIVPESVNEYIIRNTGDKNEEIAVIQAFIRNL